MAQRWVAFFVVFLCTAGGSDVARAENRYGSVRVGIAAPLELDPETVRGSMIYALDFAYYWMPRLALFSTFDVGVEGDNRINVGFGPRVFLFRDGEIRPYLSAEFLLFLSPKSDLGWRASLGAEWNLRRVTDIDNLRLFAQSGGFQYILDAQADISGWEILRFGVGWSY